MNDDDMAVNENAEEQVSEDTTPVDETKAPGDDQQSEEEVATDAEDQEAETVEESRKGAAARIRELNAQKKQAEARAQSLEERVAQLTSPGGLSQDQGQGQQPTYNPTQNVQPTEDEINPDGTINAEKYRERILREADSRTELRIRQSEAVNRIQSETNDIMRNNPELDPDSDSFDQELSDVVTEAVENSFRANPYSASPKQVANKVIKLYKKAVAKEEGQARADAAKTVSRTALRPTSVRKQEKTAAEKSIAELEAELGIVNS